MEEAQQERSPARQSASGQAQGPVQGAETFGAEVGRDRALEPRPRSFHGIEIGGVGGEADQREPVLLALGEGARREATMRVDAVPDHDQRAAVVAVKPLEEADDVLGAHGAGDQSDEEASAAAVR